MKNTAPPVFRGKASETTPSSVIQAMAAVASQPLTRKLAR